MRGGTENFIIGRRFAEIGEETGRESTRNARIAEQWWKFFKNFLPLICH